MHIFPIFALSAFAAAAFLAVPPAGAAETAASLQATDFSSQSQQRRRPNIRVYPEPQPPFWDYPRPGEYSWPGPGAKRDCDAWYVLEHRPSGTVLTPRMQCWWVRG